MRIKLFLLLIPTLFSCQTEKKISNYPDYIGDIEYNPDTDKKDFTMCFGKYIFQYFSPNNELENYKGEKRALDNAFFSAYKNQNISGETGLVRIRFVVNCKGETDRFRIMGMNEDYKPKGFSKTITDQLMQITRNLNGWNPKKVQGHDVDYYQYLIFKIENGNLIEIMP